MMYSGLIVWIKSQSESSGLSAVTQESIFVDSLQVFPWYFAFTVLMVFAILHLRFRKPKQTPVTE